MKLLFVVAAITLCVSPTSFRAAAKTIVPSYNDHRRGTVVSVEPIGSMTPAALQHIAAELAGSIVVRTGARLFRIVYWTQLNQQPTRASGLMAVPLTATPAKGLVLFLHGTNATRALAPSQPGRVDGNEETAVFAGNGFVVALPDYIGLGVSRLPHPYLIVRPQVDATIDFLRAVRLASARLQVRSTSDLFMMGFSQGGQVLAAVHREFEQRPLAGYRLRGSVGIAGPYDLRRTSLPKAIETNCRQCVGYLAWAAYAYATYFGHPLSEALLPRYTGVVPRLFNGSHTAEEIGAVLPDDTEDMFRPEFLQAMRSGSDNWFTRALAENETYAWVPVAPFRLYFGESDVDVPLSASQAFFDYAKPRGAMLACTRWQWPTIRRAAR